MIHIRTAILGGTGSIGLATARALAARGAQVTLVARQPPDYVPDGVTWAAGDIVDGDGLRQLLARIDPDCLVHLASLLQFACQHDPAQAIRVNVDGTLNVLEACRALGVRRVVFGSSIAVYGEREDTMRETDPLPPNVSLYGLTKRMGELLGERYRVEYGIEFAALRYSAVFGPGAARSPGMARVRQLVLRSAFGEDVSIDGASGDERAHLTYVDDAAEATCLALTGSVPPRCVYNVAGPPENYVTLRELHRHASSLSRAPGRVSWTGRGPTAGPVDTTAFKEDFGFEAAVSIRAGLRRDLELFHIRQTHEAKAHS